MPSKRESDAVRFHQEKLPEKERKKQTREERLISFALQTYRYGSEMAALELFDRKFAEPPLATGWHDRSPFPSPRIPISIAFVSYNDHDSFAFNNSIMAGGATTRPLE
jgi:hypothetical protein